MQKIHNEKNINVLKDTIDMTVFSSCLRHQHDLMWHFLINFLYLFKIDYLLLKYCMKYYLF